MKWLVGKFITFDVFECKNNILFEFYNSFLHLVTFFLGLVALKKIKNKITKSQPLSIKTPQNLLQLRSPPAITIYHQPPLENEEDIILIRVLLELKKYKVA